MFSMGEEVLFMTSVQTETIKAMCIHEFGGPEVMKYEDAPKPEPKDDEILVRVMAAGINPVDSYVRQGMFGKRSNHWFLPMRKSALRSQITIRNCRSPAFMAAPRRNLRC